MSQGLNSKTIIKTKEFIMASMILSKNTLEKAFGNKDHCKPRTPFPERPKTAVPGKRRPFTDAPVRHEEISSDTNHNKGNISDDVRPKTSYSNRKRNETDRQKHTSDGRLCEKASHRSYTDESLDDIDVVEYFYDRSVRDIFPITDNYELDRYYLCAKYENGGFYQSASVNPKVMSTNKDHTTETQTNSRLKRTQMKNNNRQKEEDYESTVKNTSTNKSRFSENAKDECDFDKTLLKRKPRSFKENAVIQSNLRRRLYSDTDVCHYVSKTPNQKTGQLTKSQNMKPSYYQSYQKEPVIIGSSKIDSFGTRHNSCKVIAKYTNDVRILSHNAQICIEKNVPHNSTEKPNAFQYISNKPPRKLKPLPGAEHIRTIDKEM